MLTFFARRVLISTKPSATSLIGMDAPFDKDNKHRRSNLLERVRDASHIFQSHPSEFFRHYILRPVRLVLIAVVVGLAFAQIWTLLFSGVGLYVNLSGSLPWWFFIVDFRLSSQEMMRCRLVAFHLDPTTAERFGFPEDMLWAKRVSGGAGDLVESYDDGRIFVDGFFVGAAKPASSSGITLTPAASGRIPDDHFFLSGDHPDSFDSRYQEFGLVHFERFAGCAQPIFRFFEKREVPNG